MVDGETIVRGSPAEPLRKLKYSVSKVRTKLVRHAEQAPRLVEVDCRSREPWSVPDGASSRYSVDDAWSVIRR